MEHPQHVPSNLADLRSGMEARNRSRRRPVSELRHGFAGTESSPLSADGHHAELESPAIPAGPEPHSMSSPRKRRLSSKSASRRKHRVRPLVEDIEGRMLLSSLVSIPFNATLPKPSQPATMNGVMYFAATDSADGTQVWKSDGTAAGTSMVADINGTAGANPGDLTVEGNTLFFVATDSADGAQVWKSDGTAAGTSMVADINGSAGASPNDLTVRRKHPLLRRHR